MNTCLPTRLGILACHYSAAPDLPPDVSRKLLSELEDCDDFGNPRITQVPITWFPLKLLSMSPSSRTKVTSYVVVVFLPSTLTKVEEASRQVWDVKYKQH